MMCTPELCAERVGAVLRSSYGDQRNVAKRLPSKWKRAPRAFQNWLYSVNPPRMHDLVHLMAECRELEAEVLRLVEEVRGASKCP